MNEQKLTTAEERERWKTLRFSNIEIVLRLIAHVEMLEVQQLVDHAEIRDCHELLDKLTQIAGAENYLEATEILVKLYSNDL